MALTGKNDVFRRILINTSMLISQKFLYLQENQKHKSYSSTSRYVESKVVYGLYGELVDKLDTLRRCLENREVR